MGQFQFQLMKSIQFECEGERGGGVIATNEGLLKQTEKNLAKPKKDGYIMVMNDKILDLIEPVHQSQQVWCCCPFVFMTFLIIFFVSIFVIEEGVEPR